MQIIIIILLIIIIALLVVVFSYKKERFIKEIKKDSIILPKHKDPNPEFSDVDYELLKDIIQSVELEDWVATVDADCNTMRRSYEITLVNPTQTLKIFGRIYSYALNNLYMSKEQIEDEFCKNINITTFRVSVLSNDKLKSQLKYNTSYKNLTIPLLWKYVVEYNNKLNFKALEKYNENKSEINNQLITINRDKTLNKIL